MNIDAGKIDSMITSQITGILGVYVYDTPCDVFKLYKIADQGYL